MVAISLYRGNLHKVSDVPRRWLMPNHTITLKDFKSLTRKREKALSRLLSTTTPATNPNPNPNSISVQEPEFFGDNHQSQPQITDSVPNVDEIKVGSVIEEEPLQQHETVGEVDGVKDSKGIGDSAVAQEINCKKLEGEKDEEKQLATSVQPAAEINKVDLPSDKDKKIMEIEQNLKVLNERKHKLVQMLKQILNAEEELKNRNNIQASLVRPLVPLQIEATTDSGSNSRPIVNGVGPEANDGGDLEGESEGGSNNNAQARQSHQMHSTSPSASSPLRRLSHASQHIKVPNTNGSSLAVGTHSQATSSSLAGVASSPSRFAPPGHLASLPHVSVSGTHFSASSPSPAASGGTSVFRESRITSPSCN